MPILRFSCIKDHVYAPTESGRWVKQLYDDGTQTGVVHIIEPKRYNGPDGPLRRYVTAKLGAMNAEGPLLFMVNGFQFNPEKPLGGTPEARMRSDNPHAKIFHFQDRGEQAEIENHAAGWPLQFGFQPDPADANGLAVAYGWHSQFGTHGEMYDVGSLAAWGLIAVIDAIREIRTDQPIDIVAHSMGTHLTLHMLRKLAKGAIDGNNRFAGLAGAIRRVVLLAGAEFVNEAQKTYTAMTDAGLTQGIEVFNLTSSHDDVISTVSGIGTMGPEDAKDMIGRHGLSLDAEPTGWIDLQLDKDDLKTWVQGRYQLDIRGDRPDGILDHWIHYTDRGNSAFIRTILRAEEEGPLIEAYRAAEDPIPEGVTVQRMRDEDWSKLYQDYLDDEDSMGP